MNIYFRKCSINLYIFYIKLNVCKEIYDPKLNCRIQDKRNCQKLRIIQLSQAKSLASINNTL